MSESNQASTIMRRVHLVGYSGHGKTTLAEVLIAHWLAAGLRIGSIKHTGHLHELDAPGKDSWRYRQAGCQPVAIITGDRLALHMPLTTAMDPYAMIAAHYAGCALVLVEGHLDTDATKVEVWRKELGSRPLACDHPSIRALITDDVPSEPVSIPIWPRQDISIIAAKLLSLSSAVAHE